MQAADSSDIEPGHCCTTWRAESGHGGVCQCGSVTACSKGLSDSALRAPLEEIYKEQVNTSGNAAAGFNQRSFVSANAQSRYNRGGKTSAAARCP